MKQRHQAHVIQPMYPVWVVDYGNEVEKDLMEDWLRLIVGTDSSDDCVHVDAKTGEVHHGVHSTNASNCSLSLGLVRIGKIHDILRCSFDLAWKLLFNKNFIPLRKKSRRFHWIGLCENILRGYLYVCDLAFVILKGIYGFKFPKRFFEISSRDLTSSSSLSFSFLLWLI